MAGKLVQMVLDTRLREVSPLTGTQAILLMILKCDQEMTVAQVAKGHGDIRSGVGPNWLGNLSESGYVSRTPAADGQRVVLTDKGERAIGQLWAVVESTEAEVLSGFSEAERAQFAEFLGRLQSNCTRLLDAH